MKISIAMATYNGSRYIKKQLESIKFQTRAPDELVIVDDCSVDDTLSQVDDFVRGAGFEVRVFRNDSNLGVTKNFEKASLNCNGDVIFFADQDDVWCENKIEKMLAPFLDDNCEIGCVFSDSELIDGQSEEPLGYTMWQRLSFKKVHQVRFKEEGGFSLLLKGNVVTGGSMAVKARAVREVLPFPSEFIHDEWIAITLSALGYKFVSINEPLTYYRQHSGQVLGGKKKSFRDKLRDSRVNSPDFYKHEKLKGELLLQFIDGKSLSSCESGRLLRSKLEHLDIRACVNGNKVFCSLLAIREIANTRYFKFSNGFQSLFKDFWGKSR